MSARRRHRRPSPGARRGARCRRAPRSIPPIIVPRKTVGEVRKLIDELDAGRRSSRRVAARIQFAFGQAVLVSRLIDGTFPDYERVIPTGNDKLAGRRRPRSSARPSTGSPRSRPRRRRAVKLGFDDGTVTLSARSAPDAGRAVEELDVDYAGEPLEIGFNARYILDMMQADRRRRRSRFEMATRGGTDRGPRPRRRQHALRADAHARMTALALARDGRAAAAHPACGRRGPTRLELWRLPQLRAACAWRPARGRSCCTATTAPARPTCSRRSRC